MKIQDPIFVYCLYSNRQLSHRNAYFFDFSRSVLGQADCEHFQANVLTPFEYHRISLNILKELLNNKLKNAS